MKHNSHTSSPQKKIRINSFLAQAGIASRRGADQLILAGHVKINDEIITTPGVTIDPSIDRISVRSSVLTSSKIPSGPHTPSSSHTPPSSKTHPDTWEDLTQAQETVIYALYKPKNYVTSLKPQGSYPIVRKLIPKTPRVFPVGRLDRESEGLLIMTNDGDLAHRLTHPSNHIAKTYTVHCTLPHAFDENKLKSYLGRLAKGVKIQGKRTLPADITFVRWLRPRMAELEITLKEGRNRQIRRMLGSLDITVNRLIRTKIGNLSLKDLQLDHGEYTIITHDAI